MPFPMGRFKGVYHPSSDAQRVRELLLQDGPLTTAEVVESMDWPASGAHTRLQQLERQGDIRRLPTVPIQWDGIREGGYWECPHGYSTLADCVKCSWEQVEKNRVRRLRIRHRNI